ncbi:MAG: DNA polymerase I [Bacteroidales bacterium]|nr:DNA polymerase I [Bacteroidales bacterium]
MEKLYLLDGYALIFRAYYALIRSPRINSKGENTSAIFGFVNTLEDVLRNARPDYLAVAFDPAGGTFRHEAYPEYKAQRDATPEDIKRSVPVIKEILQAYNIPILEVPGFEADDVIGTLAKKAESIGLSVQMVTPDKDYAQLVSPNITMCRPGHGAKGMELLGPAEVCEKYGVGAPENVIDYLSLTGDAADNIPGCPGVGEKTAKTLLADFGNVETLIANAGRLKGALKKKIEENVEKIRFSKFLVTIRTDVPIDFDAERFKVKEADKERLQKIYERLEFRSFIKKMQDADKVLKSTPQQRSLFDVFPTEVQEEEIHANLRGFVEGAVNYQLIDNIEDARKYCDKILTRDFVAFDTETTSLDVLDAELVGMSFATAEGEAAYVPVPANREEAQKIVDAFRPFFLSEKIMKVGQNIKFDLNVLANYGIEISAPMFDTMLAHYILQPEQRHNMDYLAEIYLGYRTIHIEELIGEKKGGGQKNMRDLSPTLIRDYACEDADITLRLMRPLREELEKNNQLDVFQNIEMPLMPVLAEMERNGVRIDTAALEDTGNAFRTEMEQLEKDIYEMAGHEFLLTSPRQVGEVLFGEMGLNEKARKTKSGQYSTSEEELEKIRHKHPIVDKILQHRGLKKLLSTYIEALPKLINKHTGHIHTSFNQAVTATGRLSSSNPNLQNIPVRGENGREIRKAFIPEEGQIFFSADYSQIELRLMAHLSGDTHLIEAFNNGEDIHAATAARIFKKPLKEVSRDERRKAKTANFGIIYGISAFGLAERMEVSRTEAKELIDNYFQTYPGVREYIDNSVSRAKELGYIETLCGRRRYLPDINSRNAVVRGYAERNAVNAPIQGTAADIIKIAMIRVAARFKAEGIRSKMILQVHDELNFSVLPEELDRVRSIVTHEMNHAFTLSVPLEADCGEGSNWLEAH